MKFNAQARKRLAFFALAMLATSATTIAVYEPYRQRQLLARIDEGKAKLFGQFQADTGKALGLFSGSDASDKREQQIRASIAKDRNVIARFAAERMRASAAHSVSSDAAKAATIKVDELGVKDFGKDDWHVRGTYEGPDEEGNRFRAPWTAHVEISFGSLQCTQIKLGRMDRLKN